jgi:hypothetical protein
VKLFKRKTRSVGPVLTRAEALAAVPFKNPEVAVDPGDDGVLLTYREKPRPWLANLSRRLGGEQDGAVTKKLQLDQLGTAVWNRIDGQTPVEHIVSAFCDEYQLHRQEAEVAVTGFLRQLGQRGLIGLK